MRIIFCGFGRAGKEIFYQLTLRKDFISSNILAFCHVNDDELITELLRNNIKVYKNSINKHLDDVEKFKPDYIISAYYKFIISDDILRVVSFKAMNCHPSLLPNYKGCFSCPWVIINNEKKTGVSFHYMKSKIDEGNIILQKEIEISESETAYSLYQKLVSTFILYFNTALDQLILGCVGKAQKNEGQYYKREVPYGGILNANKVSLEFAKRFVRAMYFPPNEGAKFIIKNTEVKIENIGDLNQYKEFFNV